MECVAQKLDARRRVQLLDGVKPILQSVDVIALVAVQRLQQDGHTRVGRGSRALAQARHERGAARRGFPRIPSDASAEQADRNGRSQPRRQRDVLENALQGASANPLARVGERQPILHGDHAGARRADLEPMLLAQTQQELSLHVPRTVEMQIDRIVAQRRRFGKGDLQRPMQQDGCELQPVRRRRDGKFQRQSSPCLPGPGRPLNGA